MIDPTAPRSAQLAALHAIFKVRQLWRHLPSGRVARVSRIVDGHLIVVVKFVDGKGFEGSTGEMFIDPKMTYAQRIKYHSAQGRLHNNPSLSRHVNTGYDLWERV